MPNTCFLGDRKILAHLLPPGYGPEIALFILFSESSQYKNVFLFAIVLQKHIALIFGSAAQDGDYGGHKPPLKKILPSLK